MAYLFWPTFASVRRITSIALILLMSLQCFYQLGVITYFHLNRDYIAEVLCINKEEPMTMCYGQCFLDNRLDVADEAKSDSATLPAGKERIDFPVFLISENSYPPGNSHEFERGNFHYIPGSSSDHSSVPFHPPASMS